MGAEWESGLRSAIRTLGEEAMVTSRAKGFEDPPPSPVESMALIHCEVSEAVEALRLGNPADKHLPHHSSVGVELADVVIRAAHIAERMGINLGQCILDKMAYNRSRPRKHGGKLL